MFDLPARWQGQEPTEIARSFIDIITHLLRLDLAFIHISGAEDLIEHRFPSELDSAALLSAVRTEQGSAPLLFELPRPNTVGRKTVRLVTVPPLGEQGVVIVGAWRENFPTAHEFRMLQTATTQVALAMQSSREARAQRNLLQERTRLERANVALAQLHAISEGLSRAHTSSQVAHVILTEGLAAVGAQAGSVFLVDESQSELRQIRTARSPDAPLHRPLSFPVGKELPITQAFWGTTGRYRVLPEGSSPEPYGLPRARTAAVAIVPLRVDDHRLGVLSLGFAEPRAFGDEERALIQAIAQQTAQACDRARLLEAEQQARLEAEQRQQRADFLSDASAIFGSSLDFAEACTRVAHLAVPRFADWAVLQVSTRLSSSLEETRTVVVHRDPSKSDLAREYSRGLLATGGEIRARITNNSIIVPISARGQSLGAILFGMDEAGLYGAETLSMVEELGLRAGVALENAQLYAAARAADRRKDEFLAMLGHELRNPLSPILTALQLMQLKDPRAFERERTIIQRQIEHMVRLVDDLLDVSRITRGKIQLKRERLDVASVLAKAVEMTAPLFEQRSHRLEFDPPRAPLPIEGDSARLAQILANLLNNAAKYTDPGGLIRLSAAAEEGQVVLRVRDSGTGISPEMLPQVFEMFVQDGRALDRSQGGLGLGLAIVRSLVELHGGAVSAHSEGLGRGSEFVVRLPLVRTLSPESTLKQAASLPPLAENRSRSIRLLIVDDNRDAAEMLAEFLASMDFHIRTAFDGPTGLEAAISFRPDIAVLDIGLPVMDGYELAEKLRAQPALRNLKLIALTGYGQESDRRRAREVGFDFHLVKPVDLSLLLSTFRDITGGTGGHAGIPPDSRESLKPAVPPE